MNAAHCLAAAFFLCAVVTVSSQTIEGAYGWTFTAEDINSYLESYFNFTKDVRDAQAATNTSATDFNAVKTIYNVGQNALRAGVPRPTKAFTERAYVNETYYDLASAYYKDPIWLGTFLGSAVNGTMSPFIEAASDYCCGARVETVRGGYRAFLAAFMMHELDAAYNNIATPASAERTLNEAVALWYGGELSATSNSLLGTANTRARRSCTNTTEGSVANEDFFTAAKAMKAAIQAGDKAAATTARNNIYNAVASVFLQAFLYNGNEAAVTPDAYAAITAPCITKCGIRKAKQAGALIYWRVVAPILAKTSSKDVADITAAFLPTAPAVDPTKWEQELKPKLEAAANKAGISWSKKVNACPPAVADAHLGQAPAAGRKMKL